MVYGVLTEHASPEQRAALDRQLADLDRDPRQRRRDQIAAAMAAFSRG